MNAKKTQFMKDVCPGSNEKPLSLVVNGMSIEKVEHFVFLGINIYPDGSDFDKLNRRLVVAR